MSSTPRFLLFMLLTIAVQQAEAVAQDPAGAEDPYAILLESERAAAKAICQAILESHDKHKGIDEQVVLDRYLLLEDEESKKDDESEEDDKDEKKYKTVWYVFLPEACGDNVLDNIPSLPNLTYLAASKTKVTDAGLQQLAKAQNLEVLQLWNTSITDEGLGALKELKALRLLNLAGTNVTTAGIAQLQGLENLEELRLQGTKVDDNVVAHLTALKKLQRLWLQDTNVTREAVAALRKAFTQERPLNASTSLVETRITVFHGRSDETKAP